MFSFCSYKIKLSTSLDNSTKVMKCKLGCFGQLRVKLSSIMHSCDISIMCLMWHLHQSIVVNRHEIPIQL